MHPAIAKPLTSRICIGLALIVGLLPAARADFAGEAGQVRVYLGNLGANPAGSNAQCVFRIEIEPVTFLVNSLNQRWKVVRIRIENQRPEDLKLSAEGDSIEVQLDDRSSVVGTFSLKAKDGTVWDSLSDDLRKALAYPTSIRGVRAGVHHAEAVHVFAFFPADKVSQLPQIFRYKIGSIKQTVTIRQPSKTKA